MIDTSHKNTTLRTAIAAARVRIGQRGMQAIRKNEVSKGHPFETARISGLLAAKRTWEIVPHCHPLPIDYVEIEHELTDEGVVLRCTVKAIARTGVEMEALTGVSIAAITLYDMLKPLDDEIVIEEIHLLEKRGGKSDFFESGQGLRAAVIVTSTSTYAGKREDKSGKIIKEELSKLGFTVDEVEVLPDDYEKIRERLSALADEGVDLVITTGGTGVGPGDCTVEATKAIIEKEMPGISEAARSYAFSRTPRAILSRATAGVVKNTLIINLPGSTGGVIDGLRALFPEVIHAFWMMRGGGH